MGRKAVKEVKENAAGIVMGQGVALPTKDSQRGLVEAGVLIVADRRHSRPAGSPPSRYVRLHRSPSC